jgi:hypothetical protein
VKRRAQNEAARARTLWNLASLALEPKYSRKRFVYFLNDWPVQTARRLRAVGLVLASPVLPSKDLSRALELIGELQEGKTAADVERFAELNNYVKQFKTFYLLYRDAIGKVCAAPVEDYHQPGTSSADKMLVRVLIEAINSGDIEKLARCEWKKCRRWFFKRRKLDRFCKRPCRQAWHRSTDEVKKQRARKVKENREIKQAQLLGIPVATLRARKLAKKKKRRKHNETL